MKYLPLYYEWLEKGEIPLKETSHLYGGLCSIFHTGKRRNKFLSLLAPDYDHDSYWGIEFHEWHTIKNAETDFTPLRQTIVLFMAAMNGEL